MSYRNRNALIDTNIPRDGLVGESAKAVCIMWARGEQWLAKERPIWLPKSQIQWIQTGPCYAETLHVPGWLASAKSM